MSKGDPELLEAAIGHLRIRVCAWARVRLQDLGTSAAVSIGNSRAVQRGKRSQVHSLEIIMEEDQSHTMLREYAIPNLDGYRTSIQRPTIAVNNFELKPALIHMIQQDQFGGGATEDPHAHLANFLEICDTVKMNGVTEDAIRLRLFSFSLKERAKKILFAVYIEISAALPTVVT